MPGGVRPFRANEIARQGWNILREDMPLPLAVLKESSLQHNSRWMQRFVEAAGAHISPHGKTTMSPELFRMHLADGAWGITLATVPQLQAARRMGIKRVLMANQLVGRQNIRYVLDELARDPEFFFVCFVDSLAGVRLLAEAAGRHGSSRPLRVLVEAGVKGGRTGCRDNDTAMRVAEAVAHAAPQLALAGVGGYEGVIRHASAERNEMEVRAFLRSMVALAQACERRGLFAPGPVLLTAGGSLYYDWVVEEFAHARLDREVEVVTRGGCYVSHDSGMYKANFARLLQSSEKVRALGEGLKPAIEVWTYVQSLPEPGLGILSLGKRDISYDVAPPLPQLWYRPGNSNAPSALGPGHEITALNDQHAFLRVPAGSPLAVGDMVACGISHPCTTFDKWRLMPVVNDAYDVVSAVTTYF
ncbi:MAG: amino acid deaminase [Alphaproteobacteria bacterium]|nr:amino acid deaminase [Alphaproteobacteria bacterium]